MKKVSITHMDNAHSDWLRAFDFYKGELGILKDRLTEIAGKNTDNELMHKVEHYENQISVQSDNIDRIAHDIRRNIASAGSELKHSPAGYIDASLLAQHNTLRQRCLAEEKAVNELRHDFYEVAIDWM